MWAVLLTIGLFCQCMGKADGKATHNNADNVENNDTILQDSQQKYPDGVAILLKVYPQQITGYENGELLMANGERIVYDDGREKDFVTMLDESDPEDMFHLNYDREAKVPVDKMSDAGRSRCEQLFKAMYGHSSAEAQKKQVRVDWFGQKIQFTSVNGAADSLRAVAREMQKHPDLHKYMKQSSTFYWRPVRGAKRQSAHSYGIAIDVNTSLSNYWLWSNPGAKELDKLKYENRVPEKIVDIFERHGFIWGGRWYHYDTMHFEFRPEFLVNN